MVSDISGIGGVPHWGGHGVHTVEPTVANVHDVTVTAKLLREDDQVVYGDSAYLGMEKREFYPSIWACVGLFPSILAAYTFFEHFNQWFPNNCNAGILYKPILPPTPLYPLIPPYPFCALPACHRAIMKGFPQCHLPPETSCKLNQYL